MTLQLDLSSEEQTEITRQAQQNGLAPDDYLHGLLQRTLSLNPTPGPTPAAPPRPDRQAMLDLLDDLLYTDKYGTAEQQREALDELKSAIDADRPGQRRIFGPGSNPA